MSNAKFIVGVVAGAAVGAAISVSLSPSKSDSDDLESADVAVVESAVEEGALVLNSEQLKRSYAIGTNIGAQFASQELDLDMGALSAGIGDAIEGRELLLSPEDLRNTMMVLMQEQQQMMIAKQQKQQEEAAVKATSNKEEGAAFLAANKQKEGVVTLESGLQYKVIAEGEGPVPTADSTVEVHYRGTLLDGTEFDSSYGRGQPVSFPVGGVIPGWTEALQLMKEGSKWELYIPSDLAYGDRGKGGDIGPGATLTFEVELLKANVN